MKFGQLVEYNMRSIFLEKSYTECDGETLFLKIKIEYISGSIAKTFIQFVFTVFQVENCLKILKLSCTPILLPHF